MTDIYTFSKKAAITAFIALLIAAAAYLLTQHGHFFLLVFSGVLMAAMFSGMADWVAAKTGWKRWVALLLSVLFFFGALVAAFWLLAPTVGEQVSQMRETLPESVDKAREWLGERGWGERVLERVPQSAEGVLPERSSLVSGLGGAFSSTLGILADLLIVIVTSLFLASSPSLYTQGLARLFPVRNRSRVKEVLGKCYDTLRKWLVGMLLAMAVIGVSTAVGYSLIGLPMAFALAFIAFLFAFVPNIGPWIAGIPAVLIGLMEGGQMALYVLLIYGGIQMVESYVLTPIIFKRTVNLPPALLLFFQVLLGLLQGGLGLLLAAPILAVLLVLVEELYVKDVLEAQPLDAGAADNPTVIR
ncbi:AI-2E family transporter [Pontibacter akesuensis]|uniref:Predicted PurR-regulated permease PerM n=1 Tax=Pontibacter akesuensis TaxID=388950 RepID=A0A1I7FKS0_9BACT|nr:AI-2E family transporter [Pontibacter akesuensis]GHA61717.1 AI-2E family transporter [Pontibacter akesuensis]SFU36738.1 Predicted PurR-regulated permease PerM [Pontibacter akesuensis]